MGYRVVAVILLGLSLYAFTSRSSLQLPAAQREGRILRVADGSLVTLTAIVEDLKSVSLVFIGELHDQASHHWAQLEVIRALADSGKKVAVGIEMFEAENQPDLDRWVRGEIPSEKFRWVYLENWNQPWRLYSDIFLFSRESRMPIVGLNISPSIVRQVARRGFASLTPEQMQHLPPLSCNVDEVYQEFIRRALGVPEKKGLVFQYFCEAQLLWDSAMAWHALGFLKENPDFTLVVLAGSGHSWKRAIPEQVRRQSDLKYRVILPEMPRLERSSVTTGDTDYLWLGLPLEYSS
jgi:uncharacterized iron-regulated protein